MMAEIAFLEAKRALADAHAQALRNQYLHNQSVIIENGLGSEGESDDEEAEKIRKEEEQRKREEEEQERERIRYYEVADDFNNYILQSTYSDKCLANYISSN